MCIVEAAQQIIENSSRGLKEIAETCGFKSAVLCAARLSRSSGQL
jgi:transcriptional regulator GlxA family with amidase domain